ncbi:hypothetical protein EDEG_03360 [Edhazardia aedis USNM 41457]|uniref:Translation initiation factor IF2/IF5 domain-containing protein n=1 Tax=Edhazardia aedis (strain USNM 41457) TaxID=1003232 RepID=J9D310_EDHAE|nr:hypothetical protein EDEG_03360 [Edhazardia aedis USNM 41457]|eukprot:EJW02206.1 hypothetical protein EDEG_03360 [Edhazardia aedis USNM 41457]
MIPIDRRTNDIYARYKMPPVRVSHIGTRKTSIINLPEISQSLRRSAPIILKYIGIALATGTISTDYCVNGIHTTAVIQDIIYKFIDECVLCETCFNPETEVRIKNNVFLYCYACGHLTFLNPKSKIYAHIEKEKSSANKSYAKMNQSTDSNLLDVFKGGLFSKFDEIYEKSDNKIDSLVSIFEFINESNDLEKIEGLKVIVAKDPKNKPNILSALEKFVIKNNVTNKTKDYVNALIGKEVCKKLDCFSYFNHKSKAVDKNDSLLIRKNLKGIFD